MPREYLLFKTNETILISLFFVVVHSYRKTLLLLVAINSTKRNKDFTQQRYRPTFGSPCLAFLTIIFIFASLLIPFQNSNRNSLFERLFRLEGNTPIQIHDFFQPTSFIILKPHIDKRRSWVQHEEKSQRTQNSIAQQRQIFHKTKDSAFWNYKSICLSDK